MSETPEIEKFWRECRSAVPGLPERVPGAWAFGATSAQADGLLTLVIAGVKTATASSLWDYENTGESLPNVGMLNIILDGRGLPRALLETTAVTVIPFDEVPEEHAFQEGEGDRSLSCWREVHERYWRENSENPRGFEPSMPVVCEQLELLYSDWHSA